MRKHLVGELAEVRRDEPSRSSQATWVLHERDPVPLHLREGDRVRLLGLGQLKGRIRSLAPLADGSRLVQLQVICEGRGYPAAGDYAVNEPGSSQPRRITLIPDPMLSFLDRRRELIWQSSGPGAWLTHRDPSGARGGTDAEDGFSDDADAPQDDQPAADRSEDSTRGA